MIRRRHARVVTVAETRPGVQELSVLIDGAAERGPIEKAISYPPLVGTVAVGDAVLLNTTAIELGLGSGGYHFVIAIEAQTGEGPSPAGHIMKLRYTPHQAKVLAVEEQASPHHELMDSAEELDGLPVLWLPLHSMLGSACAGARLAGASRVVHVMTDGACLPLWFSSQIDELKRAGLIDAVITAGQALGGDHEAVNLFSALLAARAVCGADVAVVCDGVGKVGTGTRWGASDVSGGMALNTAAILRGRPIASLRINFADAGYRHYGLSPHSITVLSRIAPSPVDVAVPVLKGEQRSLVNQALQAHRIADRHRLHELDGGPAVGLIREHGIRIESMGRGLDQDPALFYSSGAAGALAGEIARGLRD